MNWHCRVLRRLLRIAPPNVTRDQAVVIAISEMQKRGESLMRGEGLSARPPVVHEGLRSWSIWLDPNYRPCRVVVIDNQTGDVLQWLSPPR